MKYKELQAISKEELKEKLKQLKMDLIKTNAQVATGTTPKNSGSIRSIKKTIAKIKSLLQKETEISKPKEKINKSKEDKKE